MGITVDCPKCGFPEDALHPVITADGIKGIVDPEGEFLCRQCGANLAKLVHKAQNAALAPVRWKKRLVIFSLIGLALFCIASGKIWRDIRALQVWSEIHEYLKRNAVIKDVELSNPFNMN